MLNRMWWLSAIKMVRPMCGMWMWKIPLFQGVQHWRIRSVRQLLDRRASTTTERLYCAYATIQPFGDGIWLTVATLRIQTLPVKLITYERNIIFTCIVFVYRILWVYFVFPTIFSYTQHFTIYFKSYIYYYYGKRTLKNRMIYIYVILNICIYQNQIYNRNWLYIH